MNKQYFVRKIWDTIHYITVLYRNDTIHYTYCIVPTLVFGDLRLMGCNPPKTRSGCKIQFLLRTEQAGNQQGKACSRGTPFAARSHPPAARRGKQAGRQVGKQSKGAGVQAGEQATGRRLVMAAQGPSKGSAGPSLISSSAPEQLLYRFLPSKA